MAITGRSRRFAPAEVVLIGYSPAFGRRAPGFDPKLFRAPAPREKLPSARGLNARFGFALASSLGVHGAFVNGRASASAARGLYGRFGNRRSPAVSSVEPRANVRFGQLEPERAAEPSPRFVYVRFGKLPSVAPSLLRTYGFFTKSDEPPSVFRAEYGLFGKLGAPPSSDLRTYGFFANPPAPSVLRT
jgi:hypothetical protein